jgi:hypothetical protein
MKPSLQQTTKRLRKLLCASFSAMAVFGGLALVATAIPVHAYAHDDDDGDRHHGDNHFRIEVLSSRPYMVSGGDALVRVTVKKKDVRLGSVRIELNGANVTGAFRADASARTLTGLVTGLRLGENELSVDAKGKGHGRADADLTLTNYPIEGPIISGPQEFPFACTTATFVPFTGSPALGPSSEPNCAVATRVQYVYRSSTTNTFKSLPQPYSTLPTDVANTATGAKYIVRLETGTINRAIYQTAILHNPNDAAASPFAPPAGWNKRLVFPLGGGCIGGWYFQGSDIESVVNHAYLNLGYAVAASTLTTFGNNCNDLLSSETVIMVKERFIESYGVPLFTIGTGGSGGAYQSNQTGDNYPGTFDGIVTTSSFPDVTTGMLPMANSRLLEIVFAKTRPGVFSVNQMKAISGYLSVSPVAGGVVPGMINHMSNVRAPRMDPTNTFPAQILPGVGDQFRYDPATNPHGARGDVFDHTVNVYGTIPNTPFPGNREFAQRPLDNVGLQYGLKALNDGVITVDQFLELNEVIGGVDIDFKPTPNRTVHYKDATKRAYQGGRILNGGGGLASMPIITRMGAGDLNPNGDVHVRYHAQAIRARLVAANGNYDNQVIYGNLAPMDMMIRHMNNWLTAVKADTSDRSLREKVIANKPKNQQDPRDNVVDACWKTGVDTVEDKIIETPSFDPNTPCNKLFPVGLSPEIVAGSPINVDIIKCHLKPIDMADYKVPFSAQQRAQLDAIFPHGVCDWSKKGVKQVKSVPWASYGPSPVNQVFDIQDRRKHGDDDDDD